MKVLAVLSSKGGVGKSAMARSIAVAALLAGHKSAIIDADEQGSVLAWGKRRERPAPRIVALGKNTIVQAVAAMEKGGADLVAIDTPPHARPIINLAATSANSCLIVTGPYPEDLEAVVTVARIVQTMKRPAAIVLNKCATRANAMSLARMALTTFGIPLCPTAITQLVAHPYASAGGETAQEFEPGGWAAAEIGKLWTWLAKEGLV